MKQPRIPLSRETHPSADLLSPPIPNSQKTKTSRKHKVSKENSDPNSLPDSFNPASPSVTGKQSPAGIAKIKSPLPPRPPSSLPLKRKLNVDAGSDTGPCSSAPSSSDSGVKVIVRMRPLRKDEEGGDIMVEKLSNDSLTIDGQTFTFDSVADTEATQLDIFQLVGDPLVENCLGGYSSSVFAYGQTGSGKTYTMWGPANSLLEENLLSDQQGLTPRVFERLFARINEKQIKHADKQLKYQCRCSFLEIYNEQIRDLLDPGQKNLQIREDVKSGVYVENLTEESVATMKDVIQILLKGLANRRTGATSINVESSRSHSVFTCVVESRCKSVADGLSSFRTSRINLVDLAGSERQKLTGAAGDRLKEAGNINRSLSQLGNLINILAEVSQTGKQRHIPYRDSRLTFLLQESLGGNAKLAMICAISPAQSCKSETISTLRFAQRAKAIKNKAVVNEVVEDDVNVLRDMIRQLKDELLRMKSNGSQTGLNGAYSNGWNARRSLNLLKFSLNRPLTLPHVDDDGDEVMEIDEEAVEKLCSQFCPQLASGEIGKSIRYSRRLESIQSESQSVTSKDETYPNLPSNASRNDCLMKQDSDISDVSMEEGMSEIEDKHEIDSGDIHISDSSRVDPSSVQGDISGVQDKVITISNTCPIGDNCVDKVSKGQLLTMETPSGDDSTFMPPVHGMLSDACPVTGGVQDKVITISNTGPIGDNCVDIVSEGQLLTMETPSGDDSACMPSVHGMLSVCAVAQSNPQSHSKKSMSPNLNIVACDVPAVLQSPTPSVSPRVISTSRKSLRTSLMLTASQRDPGWVSAQEGGVHMSPKAPNQSASSCAVAVPSSKSALSTTEYLAASLHRGLEIIDNHRHSSPLRHSPFRFSFRPAEIVPNSPVEKVNVGVQTLPEDAGWADEDRKEFLCSNCRNGDVHEELKGTVENSNLQLVPVNGSLSGEKAKKQVPKAVEKVLTGAIRREMALEEFCGKQASEIMQLNRLVQQYKHERECNAIIGQIREDKIIRLENLMDGVLPTEDFLEEELISLRQEHELLKEKYDNHPETLRTKIEFKRVQDELERYQNFFDMGERDVLLEEIQDLRTQLHYYTDNSSKSAHWRNSLSKLTYPSEPSSSSPLNAIPESTEESADEKLEQERPQWTEMESKWISLAEELRMELESSRSMSEKLEHELESERKCSEELKEALQLAMEGHARMLEQYADLEEKHMQLLARHRKIQEGVEDVKKAAARAGVRGAESRFINALAAEISTLKVEREKERRYLRDENKSLQAQLRDTAEAVQAAGELLVRLKEAEEAVASAQKRAAAAEDETAMAYKQINELRKKHEMEIHMKTEYRLPKQASEDAYLHSHVAKYDIEDEDPHHHHLSSDEQAWKQEFEPFYNGKDSEFLKFDEPSSWFSGYDKCNI
ncbi:Belongs to the TRAFAC class myosin-kinesin ATPase super [Dionaea muscipula]